MPPGPAAGRRQASPTWSTKPKLFKLDEGAPAPADSQLEGLLAARILAAAEGADAVVFADFGYGLITEDCWTEFCRA